MCQQRLILKRASGVLLLRRVKTRLAQSRHAATLCYLSAFGGIVFIFARPSARLTLWQKVRRSIGPGVGKPRQGNKEKTRKKRDA